MLLLTTLAHAACTTATWPEVIRVPHTRLTGDFDGDGRRDRAERFREKMCTECRVGVEVRFASGTVERLGIGASTWERVQDGVAVEAPALDTFAWVASWRTVRPDAGPILPARFSLSADALWLSSGDVATLLYRVAGCWRFEELGY